MKYTNWVILIIKQRQWMYVVQMRIIVLISCCILCSVESRIYCDANDARCTMLHDSALYFFSTLLRFNRNQMISQTEFLPFPPTRTSILEKGHHLVVWETAHGLMSSGLMGTIPFTPPWSSGSWDSDGCFPFPRPWSRRCDNTATSKLEEMIKLIEDARKVGMFLVSH